MVFSVNQCRCQNSAALARHVSGANQADDCELLMGTSPMKRFEVDYASLSQYAQALHHLLA